MEGTLCCGDQFVFHVGVHHGFGGRFDSSIEGCL